MKFDHGQVYLMMSTGSFSGRNKFLNCSKGIM